MNDKARNSRQIKSWWLERAAVSLTIGGATGIAMGAFSSVISSVRDYPHRWPPVHEVVWNAQFGAIVALVLGSPLAFLVLCTVGRSVPVRRHAISLIAAPVLGGLLSIAVVTALLPPTAGTLGTLFLYGLPVFSGVAWTWKLHLGEKSRDPD